MDSIITFTPKNKTRYGYCPCHFSIKHKHIIIQMRPFFFKLILHILLILRVKWCRDRLFSCFIGIVPVSYKFSKLVIVRV